MADSTPIVRYPETGEVHELDPSVDVLSLGKVDANFQPIINVAAPVNPGDVATKGYVDSISGVVPQHNLLPGRYDADAHSIASITGLQNVLDGKAAVSHSHTISSLPVAASGVSNSTQLVRADDIRLSNARTPTAHSHTSADLPSPTVLTVGGAGGPAWSAGWGDAAAGGISFYKDENGRVFVKGQATRTSGTGVTVFVMPSGYRPAANVETIAYVNSSGTYIRVRLTVGSGGSVQINADGTTIPATFSHVSLNHLNYSIA